MSRDCSVNWTQDGAVQYQVRLQYVGQRAGDLCGHYVTPTTTSWSVATTTTIPTSAACQSANLFSVEASDKGGRRRPTCVPRATEARQSRIKSAVDDEWCREEVPAVAGQQLGGPRSHTATRVLLLQLAAAARKMASAFHQIAALQIDGRRRLMQLTAACETHIR